MIKISNLILAVGIAICMVDNPFVIAFGRFVWGLAAGAQCVLSPLYINEVAPLELKGPLGALSQFMVTLGILVPSLFALYIPQEPQNHLDDFSVKGYWRMIWLFPIVIVAIQMMCI